MSGVRVLVDGTRAGRGVTAQQGQRPAAHLARSSSRGVKTLDRAVARVLRVPPQPVVAPVALATTGSRPFETPLLFAGLRCILRYVVLPFMLPLLGVATGAAAGIVTGASLALLLTVDVIAVVAVVATLRRLWRLQHPRRWYYLPLAVALTLLVGLFFVVDARVLV
jgi:hypothetical protein